MTVPALLLEDVGKSYGPVRALDSVSLCVEPGEILALVGPSGCGKTTTLRIIAGLERPDRGVVAIGGRDCSHLPPERRGVGLVFQDYALFTHLDVAGNVGFGLKRMDRDARRRRVKEVLDLVGMPDLSERMPHELSGGQQQRVALARALAPNPAILLLDEPFSNLDPQLRRRVRHEVLAIIRSAGAAAVWVTHDHDEGLIVSDRVVVMEAGRVRQAGTPSDVWRKPADAWVASFMGTGDLVAGQAAAGRVSTVLGDVSAPGLPDGPAKILVRAEDVALSWNGEAGPNGHPGTVVRRHFSGTDNVYCVELACGTLLHSRQPAGVEIARGTKVQVSLASERLPVYPA